MSRSSRTFARAKYVVVRKLVAPSSAAFFHAVALAKARTRALEPGDEQVPGTPARHGDPVMEKLLEQLWPQVEAASGLALEPTYSYFRVYKRGDALARHVDREACEVSVSLCLGQSPARPWPLWIEGPDGTAAVRLAPGDGLVYRGMECPHWREPYGGDHVAQVFLHYVERQGEHAALRFDGRAALYRRVRVRRR